MKEKGDKAVDQEKVKQAITLFLEGIGEDPGREGLLETPERVARMVEEIFAGVSQDPRRHLKKTFNEKHEEMVLVKDIPLYSFCEHHLLPFFGKAHVAYVPKDGRVTGLSKLARVVDEYSRRPQIQERLTGQIADAVMEALDPYGVMVVIEAEHMCMTIRGVNKPGTLTLTSATRGNFRRSAATRAEAMALIRRSGRE